MLFKCGVCSEKDKRIADLKAMLVVQTEMLKAATRKENPHYAQAVMLEASHALNGAGAEQVEIPPQESMAAIEAEAMKMLSGTY